MAICIAVLCIIQTPRDQHNAHCCVLFLLLSGPRLPGRRSPARPHRSAATPMAPLHLAPPSCCAAAPRAALLLFLLIGRNGAASCPPPPPPPRPWAHRRSPTSCPHPRPRTPTSVCLFGSQVSKKLYPWTRWPHGAPQTPLMHATSSCFTPPTPAVALTKFCALCDPFQWQIQVGFLPPQLSLRKEKKDSWILLRSDAAYLGLITFSFWENEVQSVIGWTNPRQPWFGGSLQHMLHRIS